MSKWHKRLVKYMPLQRNNYEVVEMTLKQLRTAKGLTINECTKFLGVPTRTYIPMKVSPIQLNIGLWLKN